MCNVNGATRSSSSLVFSFFLEIFLQIVGRITCPTLYHLLTGLWSYSSKRYYPIKLKCYTWVMLPFMWAIIPSNSCSLCVGENHMSAVADLIHCFIVGVNHSAVLKYMGVPSVLLWHDKSSIYIQNILAHTAADKTSVHFMARGSISTKGWWLSALQQGSLFLFAQAEER